MATVKSYRTGTHRLVAPEVTLARVRPWLPVMGITRLANVTGLDSLGLPVVMACRPNARSIAVSQGKGLTLAAAQASAAMEAIETYHAEHLTLPLKLASWQELRYRHTLAELTGLPFSAAGLFHPHLPLLWIEGLELFSGTPCWLPYELVHTNYTLPLPPGSGSFLANTNGLASGNHFLEGLLHGIYEVIERDANTLWNCRDRVAQRHSGLDLTTVDDPVCREVLERYTAAGLHVQVWETTSDVELAAFLCQVWESAEHPFRLWPLPVIGSGCHACRAVALLRALTEAAQVRITFIAGSRDDLGADEYPSLDVAAPTLAADRHEPVRRFQDVPTWEAETFEDDLAQVTQRLDAAGIRQLIAVELTQPAFPLSVVRVVIPGLEGPHDDADYVSGPRAQAILETP